MKFLCPSWHTSWIDVIPFYPHMHRNDHRNFYNCRPDKHHIEDYAHFCYWLSALTITDWQEFNLVLRSIVVSNTYCVVFLFCFSSCCVPCVASFSGLYILIAPSVFSNVYLSVSRDCTFWLPLRYSLTFIVKPYYMSPFNSATPLHDNLLSLSISLFFFFLQ